jgi:hypothetical protein
MKITNFNYDNIIKELRDRSERIHKIPTTKIREEIKNEI